MLVTGSQISTWISSAIVCTFTSILFFSGYVLQQRTVRDMHTIIHPPKVIQPDSLVEVQVPVSDRKQQVLALSEDRTVNWKKVAYARTVRDFGDVCEAVMLFSELTKQRSPAQKVLMYPQEWDSPPSIGEPPNRAADTAMRLLGRAKQLHKVSLVPLKGSLEADIEQQASFDLANMLALVNFERIVYLQPKGLVLDAEMLDMLFSAPINASVTAIDGTRAEMNRSLLIQPSQSLSRRPEAVRDSMDGPLLNTPELAETILQTSSLRHSQANFVQGFNGTTFREHTAYVRFSDDDIAGPEFDLPSGTFAQVQPRDAEFRTAWRSLYDKFRIERMDACGLDIQPISRGES